MAGPWRAIGISTGIVVGTAALALALRATFGRSAPPPPRVVEIVTPSPGQSPEEVERSITSPIEHMVAQTPGIAALTSTSTFGMSRVRLTLETNTDEFAARQEVLQRLQQPLLPAGALPMLSSLSAGEILTFAIVPPDTMTLADLGELAEWDVARALQTIAGVTQVRVCGGRTRRVHITVDPERVRALGLRTSDLLHAFDTDVRGGAKSVEDLRNVLLPKSVKVSDVGTVEDGVAPPGCIAKRKGAEIAAVDVVLHHGEKVPPKAAEIATKLKDLGGKIPAQIVELEMEPKAPWLHAHVAGAPSKDVAKGVANLAGVEDVVTLDQDGEIDLRLRLAKETKPEAAATALMAAIAQVPGAYVTDVTSPRGPLPLAFRAAHARLRGLDLTMLRTSSEEAAKVLRGVPGITQVVVPDAAQAPEMKLDPDREMLARLGVAPRDLFEVIELAQGGRSVGSMYRGEHRFDVVLRYPSARGPSNDLPDPTSLSALTVTGSGGAVPLSSVVRVTMNSGPARITHVGQVRAMDALFHAEDERALEAAKKKLASDLHLPAGVQLEVDRDQFKDRR